ncbi:MAG: aminopeptidase, partial [Candidatus Aegiribacteria sp.]|nr:aminopeptidase [Candidatus Aegiribacteria sp.]
MNRDELHRKYAEIIIKTAVNQQEGKPLLIRTGIAQKEFVRELASLAYENGASLVSVQYSDSALGRMRLDGVKKDEYLDFLPSHLENMYESYLRDGWSSISLRGPENPDIMEGADSERLGRASKANSVAMQEFLKGISANKIAWNVCLYPTEAWAAKVLGDSVNWEERIWDILIPILRLDRDDP